MMKLKACGVAYMSDQQQSESQSKSESGSWLSKVYGTDGAIMVPQSVTLGLHAVANTM